MVTVPQLARVLQSVLTTTADGAARTSGFVQRSSKLSAAGFVQSLVFGWLAKPSASIEELARTARARGIAISAQGLEQRFGPAAAALLEQVLATMVQTLVLTTAVAIPLLRRFRGVYVMDSTTVRLPDVFRERWPGCGGRTSTAGLAAVKLQVQLELTTGALEGPLLFPARTQDRTALHGQAPLPPGALRLADLGYFSVEAFAALTVQGVYWLSRYQLQTALATLDGQPITLMPWLRAAGPVVDQAVLLGQRLRLRCRVLAVRVPDAVANQRRRKIHDQARRDGRAASALKLLLADWTILLTNLPPTRLSLAEALVLARIRWQIELLFKLWKSHGGLSTSRSTKPWRVLCEVYAKLLAMLVQHWLFLQSCWDQPDRSWVKAAQVVRTYAPLLAHVFAHPRRLAAALRALVASLAAGCRVQPRKGLPAAHQLLLNPTMLDWLPQPVTQMRCLG